MFPEEEWHLLREKIKNPINGRKRILSHKKKESTLDVLNPCLIQSYLCVAKSNQESGNLRQKRKIKYFNFSKV